MPLLTPVRLLPGQDLKLTLEDCLRQWNWQAGFVLSGIGSLYQAAVRYAGRAEAQILAGPFEMLSLAGTLSPDGAHLHVLLADAYGRVTGGHVRPGCLIQTTAEICLAEATGHIFSRRLDPQTGSLELVIRPSPDTAAASGHKNPQAEQDKDDPHGQVQASHPLLQPGQDAGLGDAKGDDGIPGRVNHRGR